MVYYGITKAVTVCSPFLSAGYIMKGIHEKLLGV